jgi:hypothetical protein
MLSREDSPPATRDEMLESIRLLEKTAPKGGPILNKREELALIYLTFVEKMDAVDAANTLSGLRIAAERFPTPELLQEAIRSAIATVVLPGDVRVHKMPDGGWLTEGKQYIESTQQRAKDLNNISQRNEFAQRFPTDDLYQQAIENSTAKLDLDKGLTAYKLNDGSWVTSNGRFIAANWPTAKDLDRILEERRTEKKK